MWNKDAQDIGPVCDVLEGMRKASKSLLLGMWQEQQKKWELNGNSWAREREIISCGQTGKASQRKLHGSVARQAGKAFLRHGGQRGPGEDFVGRHALGAVFYCPSGIEGGRVGREGD